MISELGIAVTSDEQKKFLFKRSNSFDFKSKKNMVGEMIKSGVMGLRDSVER